MQPKRLSILGVGLLGGSIALACRERISDCKIVGYGHRRSSLQTGIHLGLLDEAYDDPSAAVRGADLIILCTPVSTFDTLLRQIAPALSPNVLVTDVGSTKRSVVRAAEDVLPPTAHFVGSHPMAGSEKRGVECARADLFDGALCVITPTEHTHLGALEKIEAFWQQLGMRLMRLSPEAHDRRASDVSHLPHAVAAALVAMQEEESLSMAGKGFLDATRIAGGDGGLWRDILIDNRDNLRASLQRLQDTLKGLLAALEPEKADALKIWLDAAAARRHRLVEERSSGA